MQMVVILPVNQLNHAVFLVDFQRISQHVQIADKYRLLAEDKKSFRSTEELMCASTEVIENKFTGNTTIGVVITNGKFSKSSLCKIAGMAHDGYARSIRPVHTTADGDSIYAVSVGTASADQDLTGALAAEVMSEAILRAVKSAESAYGYPGLGNLR